MQCVERSYRDGKRLEDSLKYGWRQFDDSDAVDQRTSFIAMRPAQIARMQSGPDFIFEQTARNQLLLPEGGAWHALLCEQLSQCD